MDIETRKITVMHHYNSYQINSPVASILRVYAAALLAAIRGVGTPHALDYSPQLVKAESGY